MKGLNTEKFLRTLYELTARQHGVKISVTIKQKDSRLAATEESNSGLREKEEKE